MSRRALQEQSHDHNRVRQAADGAHGPQDHGVQPAGREQSDQEGDNGQLGKAERFDSGEVGGYHPFDGVFLLLEVEIGKVSAVAPGDGYRYENVGENGAELWGHG